MSKLPDTVLTALGVAAAMVPFGAAAGYAALLRSKEPLTQRAIVSALLNSGLLSGLVALVAFHYHPESWLLNIAFSLGSGLGGNSAIGMAMNVWANTLKSYGATTNPNDRETHDE